VASGLAQVNAQGPLSTDLMRLLTGAQGTMGIVVWASIKCHLLPAVKERFVVAAPVVGDLIDFCQRLERLKLGDEVLMLNRARLAAALGQPANGKSALPAWLALIGASGAALYPREKLDLQVRELRAAATEHGLDLADASPEIAALCDGSSEAAASTYDIFFLTTQDRISGFVETVLEVATRIGYPRTASGPIFSPSTKAFPSTWSSPFPMTPRTSRRRLWRNGYSGTRARRWWRAGRTSPGRTDPGPIWFISRDATATRVLRIVKRIVDPMNVMNPGKLCF